MQTEHGWEMSQAERVAMASSRIKAYFPQMHDDDANALAEDLCQSWPALPPEDAVRFFFHPQMPASGATSLT